MVYSKVPEAELGIEFSELGFNRRSKSDFLGEYLRKRPVALSFSIVDVSDVQLRFQLANKLGACTV